MIYARAGNYRGTYATVWAVEQKGSFVKGRISTSSKNQDDTYTNSNWFVTFGKNCSEKALKLNERDRIFIKDLKLENIYVADKNQSYLNFNIYSFDMADSVGTGTGTGSTKFPKEEPPINKMKPVDDVEEKDDSDKLPFDI